jgi:pteridine reductase
MDERRVAVITGGAKRVGRAVVLRLAREGFDVAFSYLSSEGEARALEQEVARTGRRALAVRADLTDPEAGTRAIVDRVNGEFGRVDVLMNNASLYEPGAPGEANLEQTRRLMAIHFESPMLLCRGFESQLRKAKGCVVNMCDLLGERPWPRYLAYCASKAALANLTLSLARELAPDVTVNGIAPGVVEWPEDYPEGEREKYLKRVPLGRAGTPEDVANLVHFLCTEGKYVTGQIIRLDGGRSIT